MLRCPEPTSHLPCVAVRRSLSQSSLRVSDAVLQEPASEIGALPQPITGDTPANVTGELSLTQALTGPRDKGTSITTRVRSSFVLSFTMSNAALQTYRFFVFMLSIALSEHFHFSLKGQH